MTGALVVAIETATDWDATMHDDMAEAPRADPGFRVYVERDGQRTDITDAVMDVYDIAVGSMDFGSGFLSTEEVGNLRLLGSAIGAERFDYQHDKCLRCGHDYERHYEHCGACHYEQRECSGFIRPAT
jgi:hypothetical protein